MTQKAATQNRAAVATKPLPHENNDGRGALEKLSTKNSITISPADVHSTLKRHMLADGFELVVDLKRSKGARLYDARAQRYLLDFFTFFSSGSVGLNHPKLMEPSFLERLTAAAVNKPSNSDAYTVDMAEFVETFARNAMPAHFKYMFFVDGGALAVENAIKAAFDWKVRKNFKKGHRDEVGRQIIHFRRAFHGRTGYTLSMTNTDPTKTNYFPKFSWPRIHNPAIKFPLNDANLAQVIREEETAVRQIKQAIAEHGDDIAALIIEPIQAEGGDNHFRKEFLVQLRTICDESDILLIFDEVQTGVAITGRMWAHEYFVAPDLMSFGKKTQICGILAGPKIDEVSENVFHVASRINSTFGGNLVDMVRFRRILEVIEEERLVRHSEEVGSYLLSRLNSLEEEFPGMISNARGRGLFCAMDLPSGDLRDELRRKAYQEGLILIGCGEHSIRFRPPLNLTRSEVDEGMEIIRKSLTRMHQGQTG